MMADEFTLSVEKFARDFVGGAEKAIRGTSIKLFSAIIKSSPVDTGRFRGNWQASDASIPTKILTSTDKTGTDTEKAMINFVAGNKDWSVFTLTNNLAYAPVIEFGGYPDGPRTEGGFSKQAPQGVLRVNVARFSRILEEEARSNLPK